MKKRFLVPSIISMLLILASCSRQETTAQDIVSDVSKKEEPHRYGGWFCPDNFGFVPVDIQNLDEVPAIADRLPTEQELQDNMSLINVDTEKYPDARALEMDLPRVAQIYSNHNGMNELIIVIQAIVVQEDTVVGYRFPNGGNGSAWMSDVTFLSEDDVAAMGPRPFYYSKTVVNASTEDIWKAIGKTDYFKQLGEKFDKKEFFTSDWDAETKAHLDLDIEGEKAVGYVGMVYGNYYLQIDYDRDGFHYSEKLMMSENQEENTTEFFVASGPYSENFSNQKSIWDGWVREVKAASESD
jgi:hypothetical protein